MRTERSTFSEKPPSGSTSNAGGAANSSPNDRRTTTIGSAGGANGVYYNPDGSAWTAPSVITVSIAPSNRWVTDSASRGLSRSLRPGRQSRLPRSRGPECRHRPVKHLVAIELFNARHRCSTILALVGTDSQSTPSSASHLCTLVGLTV